MNRGLALLFAVIGVLLLVSISYFITVRQPGLVALSSVVSLLFIAFGFVVKARIRRRESTSK